MTTEIAASPDAMNSEKFVDAMLEWPAQFDDETLNEIDSKWDNISSRRSRRLLLSMLTMDSEKIFEMCEKDPELFFEGLRCSASTLGMYKHIVHLLDIGHHRLTIGLCGVDTDASDAPFSKEELFEAINGAKGDDTEGGSP